MQLVLIWRSKKESTSRVVASIHSVRFEGTSSMSMLKVVHRAGITHEMAASILSNWCRDLNREHCQEAASPVPTPSCSRSTPAVVRH